LAKINNIYNTTENAVSVAQNNNNSLSLAIAKNDYDSCCVSGYSTSKMIEKPQLTIDLSYFKNYKVPGAFKYIEHDTGIVKEVAIKQVIFSNPATIVFWSDNTKTTCKVAAGDIYNPEYAILLCVAKKLFGSDNILDVLRCWVPEDLYTDSGQRMYCNLSDARRTFFANNDEDKK
jgi:hypothetical protein